MERIATKRKLQEIETECVPKRTRVKKSADTEKSTKKHSEKLKVKSVSKKKKTIDDKYFEETVPDSQISLENKDWDEAKILSYEENVPQDLAERFIKLLNEGCTLPFIARYRKNVVDYLKPDR